MADRFKMGSELAGPAQEQKAGNELRDEQTQGRRDKAPREEEREKKPAIDFSNDGLYLAAIILALIKDFPLDYTGLGSFPVVGTIITLLFTIMIAITLWLAGSGGKRKYAKFAIRGLFLAGGAFGEIFLIGFNYFLPMETIVVLFIYIGEILDRKNIKLGSALKIFSKA